MICGKCKVELQEVIDAFFDKEIKRSFKKIFLDCPKVATLDTKLIKKLKRKLKKELGLSGCSAKAVKK